MRILFIYFICGIWLTGCSTGHARNIDGKLSDSDDNNVSASANRIIVSDEKFEPTSLINWVVDPKNGLMRRKEVDNLVYSAQFKPWAYVICEEQKTEEIQDTTYKRRKSELDGMQYIDLKIELKNGSNELLKYNLHSKAEYEDRINYFSFGMQNDIQLVEGKDTLPCQLFHFERVYDVAPSATFLMAFPVGKDYSGDKTLIFFDHGFNNGILKFFFDGRDIKNVPQLKTL